MTPPRAFFLTPEEPRMGSGGGGLRSASLLAYLQRKYAVVTAGFTLRQHSKSPAARAWRNLLRLGRGVPPLFDRYSGYQQQLAASLNGRYAAGVVEHFWCASYAGLLRGCCDRLVLDLHNIESRLARTHANAARWPASWASKRFADAYEQLERAWLPRYDVILVASGDDRRRIRDIHASADVRVFPNALPEIPMPHVPEANAVMFSGNLEYHPNVEAVRWFRDAVWPTVRQQAPEIEWLLLGSNPGAIARFTQDDPRIRVIGPVKDAVEHLAGAQVCVAPLLSGSGTRFKILEAWAAGRAVVSTTLGAEGLGARDGEHLLLADDADGFAAAILRLLHDRQLRERLGRAGRALYEEQFSWPAAWRKLDEAGGI
jgi:glycosyltransferase involved in cell wall biosynthesis